MRRYRPNMNSRGTLVHRQNQAERPPSKCTSRLWRSEVHVDETCRDNNGAAQKRRCERNVDQELAHRSHLACAVVRHPRLSGEAGRRSAVTHITCPREKDERHHIIGTAIFLASTRGGRSPDGDRRRTRMYKLECICRTARAASKLSIASCSAKIAAERPGRCWFGRGSMIRDTSLKPLRIWG